MSSTTFLAEVNLYAAACAAIVAGMTLEFHNAPGFLIRRLHQISVSIFEQEMAEAEIEITQVQYAALSALDAYPNIDQNTLAGLIAYDRVTIGGVLARLVAKAFVSRRQSARDRRAHVLTLTAAGRAMVRRATPVVKQLQQRILGGLTAEERRVLVALLAKAAEKNNSESRAPLRAPVASG
jgi:DNA-binding MarR family transcriptional regulator